MLYWKSVDEIQENFHVGEKSLNGYEQNVLFRNDGATFTEIGFVAGCGSLEDGRSPVAADFDNDGDLDLVVASLRGPLLFYENRLVNPNHWIEVRLEGGAANPLAVGAQIFVEAGGKRQLHEISAGSGFLSQGSLRSFFGLGKATVIDRLEIRWPSVRTLTGIRRESQVFVDVPIDGVLSLRRGEETFRFRGCGSEVPVRGG